MGPAIVAASPRAQVRTRSPGGYCSPHPGQPSVPPQPSGPEYPQPAAAHVAGWQHVPAPVHTSLVPHCPQFCVWPQPTSKLPHDRPWAAHVVGWQQTLLWQTPVQGPQSWVIPHPISSVPQFLPCAAQVVGEHTPQTFAVPPPPQVAPALLRKSKAWADYGDAGRP